MAGSPTPNTIARANNAKRNLRMDMRHYPPKQWFNVAAQDNRLPRRTIMRPVRPKRLPVRLKRLNRTRSV